MSEDVKKEKVANAVDNVMFVQVAQTLSISLGPEEKN